MNSATKKRKVPRWSSRVLSRPGRGKGKGKGKGKGTGKGKGKGTGKGKGKGKGKGTGKGFVRMMPKYNRNPARHKKTAKRSVGKQNAWIRASMQARNELGIRGFHAIKRGTALYSRAKAIHSTLV